MRIHNVYEDANGESHFRDIEVDWVEETPSGKLSKRLPATGIVFRETTTDYENSWPGAAPTIRDQSGGWDHYHRQRRRDPPYRRRRDRLGRRHHRQGPHHQIIGRQTAPHDLCADRLTGRRTPARRRPDLNGRAACRTVSPARFAATPDRAAGWRSVHRIH